MTPEEQQQFREAVDRLDARDFERRSGKANEPRRGPRQQRKRKGGKR